jgi:hypothetical protein
MIMKKRKGWYVTLLQEEVERCQTKTQLLVFASIKSFSGNGRLQVGLSLRDISKRSKCSVGWIQPVINDLKQLGLILTHGTEKRKGGIVKVFSIGTVLPLSSVESVNIGVQSVNVSVQSTGTKINKLKVNKNFSPQNKNAEIWKILHEESDREITRRRGVK